MREVGDVGGLGVQRQRAALGERERPQVLHEPLHDPRLLDDRRQMRLVGGMDPVDDRFETAADHGKRRPQLMADVGEERPAFGLIGLEPAGHRVERPRQLGHGARPADRRRDARGVVARLDRPRRLHQPVQRPAGAP